MGEAAAAACPSCGEPVVAGEAFCEACGTPIAGAAGAVAAAPAPAAAESEQRTQQVVTLPPREIPADPVLPCAQCGGTEAADGYCNHCGARMPVWRDHYTEQPAPWAAGVCDRGIHHARNEDAMALGPADAATGVVAFVICDGVTSAPDSDIASLAASRAGARGARRPAGAARNSRRRPRPRCRCSNSVRRWWIPASPPSRRPGSPPIGWVARPIRRRARSSPPSPTAAIVAAGWVGDSRAYWLPDDGAAEQLSIDDSWATQQIAAGVAREVAEADPQAHAITRWLGADSPATEVLCSTRDVGEQPGWLLLCSDGLWNYVSLADDVRALVAEHAAVDDDPLAVSEALVAFANGRGGHDNITVALARLPIPPDS